MKTNISNILTLIFVFITLSMTSCSDDVDFGEQYKKTVYIVNSKGCLHTVEHFFETENDEIVLSVYCASSEPITADLRAQLKMDPKTLDSLNTVNESIDELYIDKVMLPTANYQLVGEPNVTIKAGTQYGTLSIPFNFTGLDPDVAYTIPVTLVSNDAGYDINPDLQKIVYEVKMMNQYSGNFIGNSQELAAAKRGVQPVLKAISRNTVRMPIHNLSGDWANIETNFMLLTINDDGSVAIAPWINADVTDLGGSVYDANSQTFELHYEFKNAAGTTFTIAEVISKINQ